jgi:hypothetical protein
MTKMSKLVLIAAAAAVSIASPALAQSFNPRDGTANVLPFSYSPGGARVFVGSGSPSQGQNGLHAFAMIPRDPHAPTAYAGVPDRLGTSPWPSAAAMGNSH